VKALTQMRLAGQPAADQWTLLPNPLCGEVGSISSASIQLW